MICMRQLAGSLWTTPLSCIHTLWYLGALLSQVSANPSCCSVVLLLAAAALLWYAQRSPSHSLQSCKNWLFILLDSVFNLFQYFQGLCCYPTLNSVHNRCLAPSSLSQVRFSQQVDNKPRRTGLRP